MTQVSRSGAHVAPWYRRESWLSVSLIAVAAVVAALVAPASWKTVLLALAGILMFVGAVMLIQRERNVGRDAASEQRSSS